MTMNYIGARIRGFTLIELMVTLTVMTILLVLAVPSITTTIHRNEVSSASNALIADLTYARAEAIDRGTDVSICPSSTGTSCTDGTAYETGWLVYTYTSGAVINADYNGTKTSNVILRHTTTQTGVSIQSENAIDITFGPQGEMKKDGTESAFDVCYSTGSGVLGQSTTTVPGVWLTVEGSGSTISQSLAAGTSCTGPSPST